MDEIAGLVARHARRLRRPRGPRRGSRARAAPSAGASRCPIEAARPRDRCRRRVALAERAATVPGGECGVHRGGARVDVAGATHRGGGPARRRSPPPSAADAASRRHRHVRRVRGGDRHLRFEHHLPVAGPRGHRRDHGRDGGRRHPRPLLAEQARHRGRRGRPHRGARHHDHHHRHPRGPRRVGVGPHVAGGAGDRRLAGRDAGVGEPARRRRRRRGRRRRDRRRASACSPPSTGSRNPTTCRAAW